MKNEHARSTTPRIHDFGRAEVMISIRFPGEHEMRRFAVTISEGEAECLDRLPPSRELPMMLKEQAIAAEMEAKRARLAQWLGKLFAEKFAKVFTTRDTQMGYPPEKVTKV